MKWYCRAAEQEYADAQWNPGVMYAKGQGVPLDYIQALMRLDLAGAEGNHAAIENCDKVAAQMTPADVSKAQQLARDWLAKHQR
jgi:TPR repeat protein